MQRRKRVEVENDEGGSCGGGDDPLAAVSRVGQEEEAGGNDGCSGAGEYGRGWRRRRRRIDARILREEEASIKAQ